MEEKNTCGYFTSPDNNIKIIIYIPSTSLKISQSQEKGLIIKFNLEAREKQWQSNKGEK